MPDEDVDVEGPVLDAPAADWADVADVWNVAWPQSGHGQSIEW